jgi:hypothetical protein
MAFRPFLLWSIERLLSEYEAAVSELSTGLRINSVGAGDSNTSGLTDLSPQQRAEMLWRELNLRDSDAYPTNIRQDRTTAAFGRQDTIET